MKPRLQNILKELKELSIPPPRGELQKHSNKLDWARRELEQMIYEIDAIKFFDIERGKIFTLVENRTQWVKTGDSSATCIADHAGIKKGDVANMGVSAKVKPYEPD